MKAKLFKGENEMKKLMLITIVLLSFFIIAISGCSTRRVPSAPVVVLNTSTYTSTITMTPVTAALIATPTITFTTVVIAPTLTLGYPFERSWGRGVRCAGTNDPEIFLTPCGIAVNSSDFVFIADLGNNRIVKYNSSGTQVAAWGSGGVACSDPGSGNGQFNGPFGIAIDASDFVYVLDSYNHRVQKFDSSLNYIRQWGSLGSSTGQFSYAQGIAVDNAGFVYVADTENNRIQKFDSSGAFIREWGSLGSSNGQFTYPTSIAVDKPGNYVYVSDTGNNRIQKFDSSGTYLNQWAGFIPDAVGTYTWPPNSSPVGIAVDNVGAVFVTDTHNNKIIKYDENGGLLKEWIVTDSSPYFYGMPWKLTIDSTGAVYAVCFTGRIVKFSYN